MTNNQRFVAELLVLLIVGAAVLSKAAPQKPDDVLRARRFEVLGKDGKARIELAVDEEDRPHVHLLDTQGNERAALQLYRDGSPELSLTDPANGASVLLNVEDRAAGLSIYGSHSDTPEGTTNRVTGMSPPASSSSLTMLPGSHFQISRRVWIQQNMTVTASNPAVKES